MYEFDEEVAERTLKRQVWRTLNIPRESVTVDDLHLKWCTVHIDRPEFADSKGSVTVEVDLSLLHSLAKVMATLCIVTRPGETPKLGLR